MTGIYALLLAFVIAAGAATTSDAYAQSNTDRLIDLVDTTNRNNGMLGAIQGILDGLGEQVAAVQNAITALTESVSALSGDTADMAGDVAGLTGKVDAASERIAGLDGKVDAVGTGVAGLTGRVDAATMHVDGVGAKVDAANMHINELSGKVDAINICTSDLNTRVETIAAYAADLNAKTASVEATANAVQREVEALRTAMAGHADTNQLDPSYAEKLDMISGIRTALDALGERPDETAALDAISDGIKANSARIAALEGTINMIDSQLAGVTGKLGTVETAVEQRVGPAPANLYKGEEKYKVTIGHFGDSAKGKAPTAVPATLTFTYTFSCKADVFVGRVSMDEPLPVLWDDRAIPANLGQPWNSVVTVEGNTIWDRFYDTGGSGNDRYVLYNTSSHDFNLMELKAGETLDFKATYGWNHTGSGATQYIQAKHGEAIPASKFPSWLLNQDGALKDVPQPYTKAKVGAIKIYENTVEYHSAAQNAECAFKRTSGFSTDLTKAAQRVLSVGTDPPNQLVNKFERTLNCNNLPTAITGINTEVPGGLSLHQHSTFQLLSGTGDKEKVHGVFKFNQNGTITRASGELPFTFEGSQLRINGTLAGAANLLVVVDYRTTEDNSCR